MRIEIFNLAIPKYYRSLFEIRPLKGGMRMQKLFEDYFNCLKSLHDDIKSTIDGLSQSEMDWAPGSKMNSLDVIVAHVAGSERYMIGDIVAKEPSGRDRDAEFQTQGIDIEGLNERLDGSLEYVGQVLERFTIEDLDKPCVSPWDGRTYSAGLFLFRVLGHVASHLGHAQMTRQLLEQRSKE